MIHLSYCLPPLYEAGATKVQQVKGTNRDSVQDPLCPSRPTTIQIARCDISCYRAKSTGRDVFEIARKEKRCINRVTCNVGATNIQVWNNDYGGQLCFQGLGYLGVNIYQVNEVDNESQGGYSDMWMRYYRPYGITCTIQPYHFKTFGGGITNVEVTQLDYGASNGGTC
jgi:hypothetical protein